MKDFDWTTFTKRIAVKSTMQDIYNAWTKPCEIERWFLSKAAFYDSTGKAVDRYNNIEKNSAYEWKWYLYEPSEKGKITDCNGKDFIQFTFAGACLVDVKLADQDGFVIVELIQKNIPTDDNSKRSIRLGCDSGWSFFLLNLKSVYEGGLDLRNKNRELKGMLNN
jgi:hypothetical protein